MPLGAHRTALMGIAGVSTGDVVLLETITISSDANIAFTSQLTDKYSEYIFRFYDIHAETDGANFQCNESDDASSWAYNLDKQSSAYSADQAENTGTPKVIYNTGSDLAISSGYQIIMKGLDFDNDGSGCGYLHIFNPASSVFTKQYLIRTNVMHQNYTSREEHVGGYINTTAPVTAINFNMSDGDMDAGVIKLWGVK